MIRPGRAAPVNPGVNRPAWATLLVQAVLLSGAVALLRPAISYSALGIGVAPEWLGGIAAMYALLPVFVALPLGRLTDRRGTRGLMLAGASIIAFATTLLVMGSEQLPALLVANAVLGFGQVAVMLSLQSGVATLWVAEKRSAAYGWFAFATAFGQLLGPAVLAVVGGEGSEPEILPLYLIGAITAAAMVGCSFAWIGLGPRFSAATIEGESLVPWLSALKAPGFSSAVLASVVVLAALDLLSVYLPALGVEYGISASAIGLLLAVRATASMLSRATMGLLIRGVGERLLLIGSLALGCFSIALIPVPLPLGGLIAVMSLAGIGLGYGNPLTLAWVVHTVAPQVRDTAISIRILGNRIGQTALPAAAGALTASAGSAVMFWTLAAALGAVSLLTARTQPKP